MSSRWPVDLSPRSLSRAWKSAIRLSASVRSAGPAGPGILRAMPSSRRGMEARRAGSALPGRPALVGLVGLIRLAGLSLLTGPILQQAAGCGRKVKRLQVARAQRLEQHLELLGGRLGGIDDYQVFFAQAAGAAARAIADLAQQPLAPDLQTDALRRRRQLLDHRRNSRPAS